MTGRWKYRLGLALGIFLYLLYLWASWSVYSFSIRHFPTFVFWAYLTIFFAIGVLTIATYRSWKSDLPIKARYAQAKISSDSNVVYAIRVVSIELEEISAWLCWPVILGSVVGDLAAAKGNWTRGNRYRANLKPAQYDFGFSFFRAYLALCLYVSRGTVSAPVQRLAFLIALSAICWHLSLILDPDGIFTKLKQTSGSPILKFAWLLTLDLTAQILAVAVISGRLHTSFRSTPRQLEPVIMQILLTGKHFSSMHVTEGSKLLKAFLHTPRLELLQDVIGLSFYGALLRSILTNRFKALKRTDEDFEQLAYRLAAHGNGVDALKYMRSVNSSSYEAKRTTCLAFLVSGNIDQAKIAALQMLQHDHKVYVIPTIDDQYFELFEFWFFLNKEVKEQLLKDTEQQSLSESARFTIAVRLAYIEQWDNNDKDLLLQTVFSRAIQTDRAGDNDSAHRMIMEFVPANHGDELLKLVYQSVFLLLQHPEEDERKNVILSWIASNKASFDSLCRSMIHEQLTWSYLILFVIYKMVLYQRTVSTEFESMCEEILKLHIEAARGKRNGGMFAELVS